MEMPNLDKLYQTFLSNERTMAEAFGVSHLYYLKRIHENQFPFSLLPGVTTLATCIRSLEAYLNGDHEVSLPSQKTFHSITAFFKEAYQLSSIDVIHDNTLLESSMKDIMACQGLSELKKREIKPMPKDWFTGRYYCYYEHYSAAKDSSDASYPFNVKGGILNVSCSREQLYKSIFMVGFSSKEAMDSAFHAPFMSNSDDVSFHASYKEYLKKRPDLDRALSFWTGYIKEKHNQTQGDFNRWPTGKVDIDEQELMLSLFKYPGTKYDHCQGGTGIMLLIKKDTLQSSKLLLSKTSLDWDTVSRFFQKRHVRSSISRQDDRDFLDIIHFTENELHSKR